MPPTHPDRLQLRHPITSDVTCSALGGSIPGGMTRGSYRIHIGVPVAWVTSWLCILHVHPPFNSKIQIYISACQNVYHLPILVYNFPGLFQMYLYVVLRSILRVFGDLWIFRFITWWWWQVPRPMMPIVVMPQMVQPVPLRRPLSPPPTVLQQALFVLTFFNVNDLFKANDTVCLFDVRTISCPSNYFRYLNNI